MENQGSKGNTVESMAEQNVPTGKDFFELDTNSAKVKPQTDSALKQPFFTMRVPKASNTGQAEQAKTIELAKIAGRFAYRFQIPEYNSGKNLRL